MQLDRIELSLRRRSPWEAIDLGLVMVRQWRGPLYRVWLAVVLPVALGILAMAWAWPSVGMLIVWWLKPVADRVLLKFFSEATFGEPPTPREVWKSMPALLRGGLFSSLTFRRFSPYRSFELPIRQLERQRGKALRLRNRTLSRKVAGHAFWLMFVCAHLVLIFEVGLMQLVGFLIPGDAPSIFPLLFGDASLLELHFVSAAWLIAESIVEPFYVAAGFSLYLNRRSELEGWDIEVAFRHMAEVRAGAASLTHAPRRRGAAAVAIALLAGIQIFLAAPDAAAAEQAPGGNPGVVTGEAGRVAREVLSDPVFGRDVEKMVWQPRAKDSDKEFDSEWWRRWLRRLSTVSEWLAQGMRGVLYVVMAAALAALLVVLYRYSGRFAGKPAKRAARVPETLFGLDLRASSLPADVPATAEAEAAAGRVVAALSLLYRGALVALIERHHAPFRDGDTENVCLQRVAGCCAGEAALAYFSALLEAWKASAYAGSPPSILSVRALCRGWREHFARRGEAT